MEIITSFCCMLIHIPTLMLRYIPFKEKVSQREKKILISWYTAGIILDFILCLWMFRDGRMTITFYKFNTLLYCVIMGIVNILVIKGYTKEHLFSFGLTALIVWLTFATSAYIAGKIGYDVLGRGILLETLIGTVFYVLLYPWYRRQMCRTITPFLNIDSEDYWNHIWFIPIAMFLSGIFSHDLEEYTATVLQLISRTLIGLATIVLCRKMAQDYKKMQEKTEINQQLEMQKKYYKALTEAVQTEREVRHNFKHQLAALKGFLDTGNSEELRKYCDVLENGLLNIAEIPYTGNAAADGILYHYVCMAKEKKITLKVCCRFDKLSMSDTDLCCILGNALDNAVTACEGYDGEKYITVVSEKNQDILLLTVDNSFDGIIMQKGEKILSRKRKNEEGIGIRSMKQICEKYGGTSHFEAKGNRFEASFMLHI